jgi:hypothetical protein
MKPKRNEVKRINIVQAQVEEIYFIFNLSEMSEIQWPHILYISLKQEKQDNQVS